MDGTADGTTAEDGMAEGALTRRGRFVVAASAAVVLAGGYLVGDVYDVVPGVLTREPEPTPALPYPAVDLPGARPSAAVVDPLAPSAPVPDPAGLQSAVDRFVSDPDRPGDLAVRIVDSLTGEVLVERDPAAPVMPASSAKLLTAAAALSVLGPQTRFTTEVVTVGGGLIVLVGGGDILLGEGAGDPTATRGHAGVGDLAEQVLAELSSSGTTAVRLGVDDAQLAGARYADDVEGWDRTFTMAATTVAVNGGVTDGAYVADPALHATEVLAQALRDGGVEVEVVGRESVPDDARVIASTESATVELIVREMLKISDNGIADVLSRLVAIESGLPGDATSGGTAVVDAVAALGVDTSGTVMIDGAGLSATDRTSVTTLTDLVQASLDPANSSIAGLVAGMPTSWFDGTLDERLDGDAAGRVRAKTGTLAQAVSLTGTVMTEDDRLLTFSVVVHSYDSGGSWAARVTMDRFIRELAACGC